MTSRILSFLAGAAVVAALAYAVPAVTAQTNPGICPGGIACPAGGQTNASMAMGHMGGAQDMSGGLIGVAADKLGMTRQALLLELQNGKTIADLALARGVPTDAIVDAFVAPHLARFDALIKSGAITQKQADDARDSMRTHIVVLINSPMDSWVRQAHDPLLGAAVRQGPQAQAGAGRGQLQPPQPATPQPGGHGPRWRR
ncbi:MAG: hypothetical protein HXY39_07605 [Chloroflexi bacterium]|nr:hypothetical protein [Chloroflexota bacterium]